MILPTSPCTRAVRDPASREVDGLTSDASSPIRGQGAGQHGDRRWIETPLDYGVLKRRSTARYSPGFAFTMMVYPNRTHCICEGDSTTVHLFTLLTRYVDEHLGRH